MKKNTLTQKQWVQLINRARQGEKQAFEEICILKTSSILFVCNDVLHNWEDAEDATQEVLLQMQSSIKRLTTPEAFPAWLNQLSLNISWMMRRKQMNQPFNISLDESEMEFQDFSSDALPAELLETKESQWRVMEAIKSLPYHYRMSIFLHYYEGLKINEVAEAMEITPAAAKHNIQRGRLALKEKLLTKEKDGTTIPIAAFMPVIFDKTEMELAKLHSVNVLKALGITPALTTGPATAVMTIGKVVGTFAATVLLAGTLLVAMPPNEPSHNALAKEPVAADKNSAPVAEEGQAPSNPTLFPSFSGEATSSGLAPQPTQSQPSLEEKEKPTPSLPSVSSKGTAVMGRIYFNNSTGSIGSIPGITVQLYRADTPEKVLKTTQTLAGQYAGWYVFESLEPGSYIVKPLLPLYLSSSEGDSILQNGLISKNGQTVFEAKANQVLTLDLPVSQLGNVSGRLVTSQPGISSQLSGIMVKLYSDENYLVMQTTTQADGSYRFDSPPVFQTGEYTLQFALPADVQLTVSQSSLSVTISPGENVTVQDIAVSDTLPPVVTIQTSGTVNAPTVNRETAFIIPATDAGPIIVEWVVEDSNSLPVARGQGRTPGSQLNALPAGEYVLTVTAKDSANTIITAQRILYLG